MSNEYLKKYNEVMRNISTSGRLMRTLIEFDSADVLDALMEAELLVDLMKMKWESVKNA